VKGGLSLEAIAFDTSLFSSAEKGGHPSIICNLVNQINIQKLKIIILAEGSSASILPQNLYRSSENKLTDGTNSFLLFAPLLFPLVPLFQSCLPSTTIVSTQPLFFCSLLSVRSHPSTGSHFVCFLSTAASSFYLSFLSPPLT
jgi:hypothetical protein